MRLLRTVLAALTLVAVATAGQTSDKSEAVSINPDYSAVMSDDAAAVAPITKDVVSSNDAITIPQMMSYQGRLTDASGVPVSDGNYRVEFRLYTEAAGGSPFWTETQSVTTRDGLFSVLLGSVTPIGTVPATGAAYLGMSVENSTEMAPRLRIAGTYSSPGKQAGTSFVPPGGTDADYDWVRASPPDSVLYTIHRLGLVRGESQNKLYGIYGYTQTIFGSSCTTGASGYNVGNIAIGGGYGNRAWAPFTAVCGGRNNKAGNEPTDTSAIVVGGFGNQANAKFAYVAGGLSNIAGGLSASIGGGESNTASGNYSAVGGGMYNEATNTSATVGGGYGNTASGLRAVVGGGYSNTASGSHAVVPGGYNVGAGADYTLAFGEGFTTSTPRAAVFYHSGGPTKLGIGVQNPAYNVDVAGTGRFTAATASDAFTVTNTSTGNDAAAINGTHDVTDYYGIGVRGVGGYEGVRAECTPTGGNVYYGTYSTATGGSGTNYGVYGYTTGTGTNRGVYGYAGGTGTNYGVYGSASGGTTNYAGYFSGNARVTGTLSKGAGSFQIDHPLDPQNKYLFHSFVESPDMMNVYNGEAVLDASGRAQIELPDYFKALNRNPRIQLTGVGSSDVFVVQEVTGNRFAIGGKPGIKVFWQVTGIRQDPFANANRIQVEVDKPVNERGKYIHPEAYGQPRDAGIDATHEPNDPKAGAVRHDE